MFLSIIHYPATASSQALAVYGCCEKSGTVMSYETLEKAKAAATDYVNRNKATLQNGYTIHIIDLDANQVVSTATIPAPQLNWTDTPSGPSKTVAATFSV